MSALSRSIATIGFLGLTGLGTNAAPAQSNPHPQSECHWFGNGCWRQATYDRTVSGGHSAARDCTKKSDACVARHDMASTNARPRAWTSFHIGGY